MKSQPKWQKVRILHSFDLFPHLANKEAWVKTTPPRVISGVRLDGREVYIEDRVTFALYSWNRDGNLLVGSMKVKINDGREVGRIEFLHKFSNHVEPVPFEEWSDPNWQGMEDGQLIGEEYGQDVSC